MAAHAETQHETRGLASRPERLQTAEGQIPYDATVYGAARTSPTSYYAHHLAAISAAIVTADALVVLQAAAHLAEAGHTAPGRPFFSV